MGDIIKGMPDISPAVGDAVVQLKKTAKKLSGVVNAAEFGVTPSEVVGNSASLQALIDSVRASYMASNHTTQPIVDLEAGTYIIDKEVKFYPYIKFKTLGTVVFKVTHNGTGFHIVGHPEDPTFPHSSTSLPEHLRKNAWLRGKLFNGTFVFTGDFDHRVGTTKTVAIEIGARDGSIGEFRPTSRYTMEQLNIYNFDVAIKMNTYNNYIGTFDNCHIEGVNHFLTWGQLNGELLNSGENFNFNGGVIAGCKKQAILLNIGGVDITFNGTSFDFNASPLVNTKESGVSIRFEHCYFEEIGNGSTDEQLLWLSEANKVGSTTGRSTMYLDSSIFFLRQNKALIKNMPNPANGGFVELHIDVNAEFRFLTVHQNRAIKVTEAELVDTTKKVFLYRKNNINPLRSRNFLSYQNNILSNGDFSKSVVGTDLISDADPHWNRINPRNAIGTISTGGINGSNCVNVAVSDASENWLHLSYKKTLDVKSGTIVQLSSSIKIPSVNNSFTVTSRLLCYDVNDNLTDTLTFVGRLTDSTTNISIDEYSYPFMLAEFKVPSGVVKVRPEIVTYGATVDYSINDVQMHIKGD